MNATRNQRRLHAIAIGEGTAIVVIFLASTHFFGGLVTPRLAGAFATDIRGTLLASMAGSLIGQAAFVTALLLLHRSARGPLLEPGVFGRARPAGWLASGLATAFFAVLILSWPARGLPIAEPSLFNVLGSLLSGPGSGTAEEIVCRGALMARFAHRGLSVRTQVLLSGLLFGFPHASFGLFGGSFDPWAAFGAVASTTVLGVLYAVAYHVSGRRLWPAIAGHALLNVFVEPWLVLSFLR